MFQELHDGDANVLVCAPTGSGKTVCAELALMRLFTTNPTARAVYIAPKAEASFDPVPLEDFSRSRKIYLNLSISLTLSLLDLDLDLDLVCCPCLRVCVCVPSPS